MVADNKVDNKSKENLKRSDFLKHLPKKIVFKKSFSQFFIAKENFIGKKKESDPFNPKKA